MTTGTQSELLAKIAALVNEAKADRPRTTIAELVAAYAKHAAEWYSNPVEADTFARVGDLLIEVCGADFPADDFGPKLLKAVRERMIDSGWVRSSVNRCTTRVRTIFKYGVAEEMISASTWHGLLAVASLPAGRTRAKEGKRVRPATWPTVLAASFYMTAPVRAMVWLQWFTGARGGELFGLTPGAIDRTGPVWKIELKNHKTAHRGRRRVLLFGPCAQAILKPFLDRPADALLFTPAEGRRESLERRTLDGRAVSVKPWFHRAGYNRNAYCVAVKRACKKAGVPHTHPHMLRHSAATRIRAEHGLDAAMVLLGHADARTTERYAEPDTEAAKMAMAESG